MRISIRSWPAWVCTSEAYLAACWACGDVVDLDLDAGVLGEALADLGQLLVGGGREVVPAEIRDLALLAAGGWNAGGQDTGEAGAGRGDELTAGDLCHNSSTLSERLKPVPGWQSLARL